MLFHDGDVFAEGAFADRVRTGAVDAGPVVGGGGSEVDAAAAEALPFADATFDQTPAELVVHFMADPTQGLREMLRVTKPRGTVAACVWDHAGDGR